MTKIVDNITLDKDNVEFNNAAEFIRHTDKLVYLTGKAGTGKTTFLKYIKETTDKNTVILAPTGVAAINAGGDTIHSFFQIPFGPFVPNDSRLRTRATDAENKETVYTSFRYRKEKRQIIENLELLIIDEISMVRADVLDVVDRLLKVYRNKPHLPFGGVQVILIGDTFQLPPIADKEQWDILSQFYKTPFFFSSRIIEENTPVYIELKKIYRQSDQNFIDLLNRVRINQVSAEDLNVLNAKYDPSFSGDGSDYIILATHNHIVDETNDKKLNQLKTQAFFFEAKVTGTFPEKHKPTDHNFKLKVGAQIMFIKNDTTEAKAYYNGKIGKIKELAEDSIIVEFDDDSEVKIKRDIWYNIRYSYNKEQRKIVEDVVGTFEQFPIRLAWAVTVHKSQGLTFEKVIADLGSAFAPGQVYVALSRCTSFSGLVLKSQLHNQAIKTDPRVLEFAKNETQEALITKELNTGKADFYYRKAREEFVEGNLNNAFDFLKSALKYRNDLHTDAFKKFINVQGSRLLDFKEKYHSLYTNLDLTYKKLEEAIEIIDIQDQEITYKSTIIEEQEASIALLVNQAKEFENETKRLKKEIKDLESKLTDLKAT